MITDFVKMENMDRLEMINGKKVLDENKMEYETPFEKRVQGIKNGRKYSMSIQKKPKMQKRVTFRVWNPVYRNHKIQRMPTPYYPNQNSLHLYTFIPLKNSIRSADNSSTKLPVTDLNNGVKMKKSKKCKDTKKRRKKNRDIIDTVER